MSGHEFEYVKNAFETNWIAPLGPHVDGFELDLQEYVKVPFAAALSSGTAAIHLALILLGVQNGDEVLCQSFTFSGSANPIMYQGAQPVFIDSENDTWNMCPDALRKGIEDRLAKRKKPKAIILVHLYGMPAKIDDILAISNEYEIPIIEDAAEALGSSYYGKMCGSFGRFGILSFNGNKIITTSGGGALLSYDSVSIERARFLATQARDNAPHYQHSVVGYNYRMSNVCAAIGRGQMQVIEERIEARRANHKFYEHEFKNLSGISFLQENDHVFSNRWLTCIQIDSKLTGGLTREHIRLKLESLNIESRPLWKPMHLQPIFEGMPYYGDHISENLFNNGLCIPSGSNLKHDDLKRVSDGVLSLFK